MANVTAPNMSTPAITRHLTVEDQLSIAAHSLAALLSLIGNILVTVVYAKNSGGRIRSMNNMLLINLSVSVIMYTCNNYTMTVYSIINGQMHWGLQGTAGMVLCKAELVLLHGLFLVCHLSVLTIAIERFLIVCFPLNWIVTNKVIKLFISSAWLVSAALYSPFLYLASVQQIGGIPRCVARFVPSITLPWFKVEVAVLLAVTIALLLIYLVILCRLYVRRIPGQPVQAQVRRSNRINRKVTLRVVIILVLFYFCWLPFNMLNVFYFTGQIHILVDPTYQFFVEFLPFLYGSLCPWVFPLLHEDFRQGMVMLLCCNRRRRRSVCQMQLSRSQVQNSVAGTNSQVTALSII